MRERRERKRRTVSEREIENERRNERKVYTSNKEEEREVYAINKEEERESNSHNHPLPAAFWANAELPIAPASSDAKVISACCLAAGGWNSTVT